MKSQNITKSVFFSSLLILILGGWFFAPAVMGEDYGDMTEEERQEELEKLNEKAEKYQDIIDIKQKQKTLLSGQIDTLAGRIMTLERDIRNKEEEIGAISENLENTSADIAEKERLIVRQKEVLSGLVRRYRSVMEDETSVFLASDSDVSDLLFKREDWLTETGERIRALLREMEETKTSLENEQEELERRKDEVEVLKRDLHEKNENLADLKAEKETQYAVTVSEERKYQDKLARIEAQKNELFNFGSASNISEIFKCVESSSKPDKKYQTSTSWYYSQRDSRWAEKEIGDTKSTMKDYGCAVSSVAMVFTELGSRIDPGSLAKKPIFYYDLIEWPSSWSAGIERVSSVSHGNVSWPTIDRELKDGNPVIVHIKWGGNGHYVVIHSKDNKGRYVVHDPYFGPNIFLDTSASCLSGSSKSFSIDQMIIYND